MAKIIQFQRDSQPRGQDWNAWDRLTVLYDDGSVWIQEYNHDVKKVEWRELESYPPNATQKISRRASCPSVKHRKHPVARSC